jgi:hypothetical protein
MEHILPNGNISGNHSVVLASGRRFLCFMSSCSRLRNISDADHVRRAVLATLVRAGISEYYDGFDVPPGEGANPDELECIAHG